MIRVRNRRKKRDIGPFMTEVKHALLYHVEIDTDGRFKIVERARLQTWGPAEGEHKILTVGITERQYLYTSNQNNNKSIFNARKTLESMGRGVNLTSKDNIVAALVKHFIFYPVLITFYENDEGQLELGLYTARTFTAGLAILRVRKRFEKATKEMLELVPNEKSEGRYSRMLKAVIEALGSLKYKKKPKQAVTDDEDYEEKYSESEEYDESDEYYSEEEDMENGGE